MPLRSASSRLPDTLLSTQHFLCSDLMLTTLLGKSQSRPVMSEHLRCLATPQPLPFSVRAGHGQLLRAILTRPTKPTISEDKTIYAAAPVPAVFICPICGNCLSSQDYLDKHMLDSHAQRPQGRLECCYCPYTSNRRSKVTRHERTHTGARPFSCPSCNKNFVWKHHLVRHQTVHTGEKPYKCTICGRQFRDAFELSKHGKLHLHKGKPYVCRYCGQPFRLKGALTQHLLTHT